MQSFSFKFKPSVSIRNVLIVLHLAAIGIVISLAWSLYWQILLLALIAGSGLYYYRRDVCLATAMSPRYLLYRAGQWWLQCNSGGLSSIQITSHTVVLGVWIFLDLREVGKRRRYSLWLWARDYPAADFKQLARMLRLS